MQREMRMAEQHQANPYAEIERVRAEIDLIDQEIVELLNKRAEKSLHIRSLKEGEHLGLYDAKREAEILTKLSTYNHSIQGPLFDARLHDIYRTILKVMKEISPDD